MLSTFLGSKCVGRVTVYVFLGFGQAYLQRGFDAGSVFGSVGTRTHCKIAPFYLSLLVCTLEDDLLL